MVKVKICGITSREDALTAVAAGADALGFVFYDKSPRYVSPDQAAEIIRALPPFVQTVGLFVNQEAAAVNAIADRCGLDIIQLHGEESPEYCRFLSRNVLKAIPVQDRSSLDRMKQYRGCVRAFLLDTHKSGQKGGTGESFDWLLARQAKEYGSLVLAGGLNAENVAVAIQEVSPLAVDVASGVEAAPGKKDHARLRAFFKAVEAAHQKSKINED